MLKAGNNERVSEEMEGERCGGGESGDWQSIFEALKSSDVSFFATSFPNFNCLI